MTTKIYFFNPNFPCIQNPYPLKALGMHVKGEEIHAILSEIDVAYNGRLTLSDYLQVTLLILQSGKQSRKSKQINKNENTKIGVKIIKLIVN